MEAEGLTRAQADRIVTIEISDIFKMTRDLIKTEQKIIVVKTAY